MNYIRQAPGWYLNRNINYQNWDIYTVFSVCPSEITVPQKPAVAVFQILFIFISYESFYLSLLCTVRFFLLKVLQIQVKRQWILIVLGHNFGPISDTIRTEHIFTQPFEVNVYDMPFKQVALWPLHSPQHCQIGNLIKSQADFLRKYLQ